MCIYTLTKNSFRYLLKYYTFNNMYNWFMLAFIKFIFMGSL